MQTRVKKEALLGIVKENRDKHRQVFEAALDGYRQEAQRILENHIKMLAQGKTPSLTIMVSRPEDHTTEYDQIVRMLELSVDDTFELDDRTFAQFVMDDWQWKRQWLSTSNSYAAGTVKSIYGEIGE